MTPCWASRNATTSGAGPWSSATVACQDGWGLTRARRPFDTTTELIATAGTGLKFFENYYTGTADASGKLWPVVDAA